MRYPKTASNVYCSSSIDVVGVFPSFRYEEASELSYFGASVLHPIAMQPAMKSNVPVRIKNSYNPSAEGSIISTSKDKIALVRIRCLLRGSSYSLSFWCWYELMVVFPISVSFSHPKFCYRLRQLHLRETSKYSIFSQRRCWVLMVF